MADNKSGGHKTCSREYPMRPGGANKERKEMQKGEAKESAKSEDTLTHSGAGPAMAKRSKDAKR